MPTKASHIPALPVPLNQANTPWPTFALTTSERQEIVAGKYKRARLEVPGTLVSGGAPSAVAASGAPSAVAAGGTPSATSAPGTSATRPTVQLVPKLRAAPAPTPVQSLPNMSKVRSSQPTATHQPGTSASGMPAQPAPATPIPASPTVNLPPISTTSGKGGIVRTTTTQLSSATSLSASASASAPTGPVRSSGAQTTPGVSASGALPSYSPPPVSPPVFPRTAGAGRLLDTWAGKLALAAFISPWISILAFFVGLGTGLVPADLLVLFGSALASEVSGIAALRSRPVSRAGSILARWGISLATLSMLGEIVRIIIRP